MARWLLYQLVDRLRTCVNGPAHLLAAGFTRQLFMRPTPMAIRRERRMVNTALRYTDDVPERRLRAVDRPRDGDDQTLPGTERRADLAL